jgi:hypothetical protein
MELKRQKRIANEVTRLSQQLPLAWEFWSIPFAGDMDFFSLRGVHA